MDDNGNSEALSGYGTGFFLTVGGQKIEIDEVTKVPFAEETANAIEVTHFKSPNRRKEYKAGMIESGEDTLELNYVPGSDTDVALRTAHNSGEVCAYETYLPAPANKWWKISGYLIVLARGRAVPIDDRMTQSVTVRFTGASGEASAAAQPVAGDGA
jgi:predicted secreted protein